MGCGDNAESLMVSERREYFLEVFMFFSKIYWSLIKSHYLCTCSFEQNHNELWCERKFEIL